jgi:hypothetical protein
VKIKTKVETKRDRRVSLDEEHRLLESADNRVLDRQGPPGRQLSGDELNTAIPDTLW